MTSSGPLSPASNAQGLSHMHDDSEREIVLLGPTTNPCSFTDNEILGSPSGEVILTFHGSHQNDENYSDFACGDKSKTDSKSENSPLSAVQDQLNVISDQLSQFMRDQFSQLIKDQFVNMVQDQMSASNCYTEGSGAGSHGKNVRASSSSAARLQSFNSQERDGYVDDSMYIPRERSFSGFNETRNPVRNPYDYRCANSSATGSRNETQDSLFQRHRVHFEHPDPLQTKSHTNVCADNDFPRFQPQPCFSQPILQSPTYSQGERNKKPANYDGKSSWSDYLIQFEMIAELNKWDNLTKAYELATSLRGDAQTVLSDISPNMRRNYQQLVNVLGSRFEPRNQSELYRAKLKNKVRKRGEKLEDLAHDIKSLTRYAYPNVSPETREQLSKDCFIDSLCDAELEWAVYQGKPYSLQNAVTLALECEAFQNGRKQRSILKYNRSMNEVQYNSHLPKSLDSVSRNPERVPQRPRENMNQFQRKGPCHYCGFNGHWKSECRKFQRDQNMKRPPGRPYFCPNQTRNGSLNFQ